MPNYTVVLNEEIARIARKEIKTELDPLLKKHSNLKKRVSELNKTVAYLESKIYKLEKHLGIEDVIPVELSEEEVNKSRVNYKYILNVREKYNLSRREMAILLDVNANSIYLWENERANPRFEAKAKIIQLRNMGKKKVQDLLKQHAAEE
jgi:DNA-binding XRE family transcriptional regulator